MKNIQTTNIYDICKGCRTLEFIGPICITKPKKGIATCPCLICLIKGVCESSCTQFDCYRQLKYVTCHSYPL